MSHLPIARRTILATAAAVAGLPGLACALVPTPAQTPGPFYPKRVPPDAGSDLVRMPGHAQDAKGTVLHLSGRVLDASGKPVAGALIEIWQCDANGRYHYVDDRPSPPLDPDFAGYGRTRSAADGSYAFRTIRPVAYPGRTPHIHFQVTAPGGRPLVTQMYVAGEPLNAKDGILVDIRDPASRERVVIALAPAPGAEPQALAATFDIVLPGQG